MSPADALDFFTTKAQVLGSVLRAHDAENADFRVDLREGKFWWQDSDGVPLLEARTAVVCTYALSNQSVLMAWGNQSLPPSACLPAVEDMQMAYDGQTAGDVWALAAQAAAGAGAEFLYRAPNPQTWIFLALWGVRTAGDDAATPPRAPRKHVLEILDHLRGMRPSEEQVLLLTNYGTALCESAVDFHAGHPWAALVGDIGARLVALASAAEDEVEAALAALKAEAEEGL